MLVTEQFLKHSKISTKHKTCIDQNHSGKVKHDMRNHIKLILQSDSNQKSNILA